MKTNAQRAERAEAALLAYIDHTHDSRTANEIETWFGDLLCDLRHLAKAMRVDFNPNAGEFNFEAECSEDEKGHFVPAIKWLKIKRPRKPKKPTKPLAQSSVTHTRASEVDHG